MAIGINLNDEGGKQIIRESRPFTHLYSVVCIDPIGIELGPVTRYYSDGTSEIVGHPEVVLRKELR